MKFRKDFVTNSSSSSYIVVARITYDNDLLEYMKNEYGKYGMRLMEEYITTAEEIKNYLDETIDLDYVPEDVLKSIEESGTGTKYLAASFISWTNDGDTNGDDVWLYEHIPDKYKCEIYQSSEG